MKIAIVGASGHIGSRVMREALSRGHEVTAIVRDPAKVTEQSDHLRVVQADVFDVEGMLVAAAGHDVLVSAFGPRGEPSEFSAVAHNLIRVMKELKLPRLIVVGGAGSLEVAPGLRLFDTPEFPEAWRAGSKGQGAALDVYRASDVDWTYFSPAGEISPGERTGAYRTGGDQLVVAPDGSSTISTEDYAVALIDEIERPQFIRRRFTVGY